MKIPHILKLRKKRIIILAVVIVIAIIGFNFFAKPKQAPMQFASAKLQDIKSTVSSSGNLTGKNVADLKFKSSGKLLYINVKVGDEVYAGEVIAGLDTQQLSIELQQAQNTLRDKQALVDKALDDVKNHASDETFTQRVTRTTAQVAKDNAVDNVKAAQRAFQDAVIISPITGLVTKTPYIPGQVIGSDAVAQVVDFSLIFFDTDIDEADIGKVSLGQKAEVTLDAYPDKVFEGVVDEIIPQTKQTSSGATVVTVRIKLDETPKNFINGLSGQSEIIISRAENVLIIPIEALGDNDVITLQSEKGQKKVKVTTGIQSDTDVQIKEGLQEGDKILLNPK